MSVDMQLYFIAPAIVWVVQRFGGKTPRNVALVSVFSCIGCTLAAHVIADIRNVYVCFQNIDQTLSNRFQFLYRM